MESMRQEDRAGICAATHELVKNRCLDGENASSGSGDKILYGERESGMQTVLTTQQANVMHFVARVPASPIKCAAEPRSWSNFEGDGDRKS
jgi:hypothetical protein